MTSPLFHGESSNAVFKKVIPWITFSKQSSDSHIFFFLKWCFNKNKRFLRGGRIILTFSSAFSNAPYPVSFPEKGVDYSVSGAQRFQLSKSNPAGGQIESMLPSVIATDIFKTVIFQMARFSISDNQYLRWLFMS